MADDGFEFPTLFGDDGDESDDEKLAMDIESFLSVLDEDCVPSESSHEDSSLKDVSPGESGVHDNFLLQNGNTMPDSELENQGPSSQTCSSPYAFAGGYRDTFSVVESDEIYYVERDGVSEREMPSYSVDTSLAEANSNYPTVCGDSLNSSMWKGENDSQIKHIGDDVESEHASHSSIIENVDGTFEDFGTALKDIIGVSRQQENDSCTSFEMPFVDVDRPTHFGTSTNSTICQGSDVPTDFYGYYPSLNSYQGINVRPVVFDSSGYLPSGACPQFWKNEEMVNSNMKVERMDSGYLPNGACPQFWKNEEMVSNMKAERMDFLTDTTNMISGMHLRTIGRMPFQDSQFMPADSEYPSFFPGNVLFEDSESAKLSCAPYISSEDQSHIVKAERDEMIMPYQNSFHNEDTKLNAGQEVKQLNGMFPTIGCQNDFFKSEDSDTIVTTENANYYQALIDETANKFPRNIGSLNSKSLDKSRSIAQASINGKHYNCVVSELEDKPTEYKSIDSQLSKRSTEGSNVEDDFDVCIIEDISHPAPTSWSSEPDNSLNMSQSSRFDYTQPYMVGGTRPKPRDEQYVLRAALQDLSQPKAEVSPPDGLLAVPLLRHQRIALSWMVQKETSSLYCCGGILADDQGLGKTVSTIALILKERPPLLKTCNNALKNELETLDLDDDPLPENGVVKKVSNMCQDISNRNPITSVNLLVHAKGRPSAGTLIVCPTSVLRQWADELQNKVTCKANLSVLVYHGSSRTKDPYELSKYDVVLTTYSIVSMEVPKQPLVDKDDQEKGVYEDHAVPSKKRKCPPSSSKSGKKGLDSMMREAVARSLAKVAWFRVVLDEAQSIKNHRTQVARACWGLRAKRRWCLSGTPIQNAIDDLYSYFRFLRYDPYAVYTSFCSTIKIPISRNPSKGYRKLQAVLKTIMLRRTKGTLLDGEPIISLPPKSVELKKVEFSQEERDFYSKLEADSRAQFQEYADAGTVKQNYVNILLMLLRLRQACDHPLLVKRYNSTSLWKSSVEMAKKLPQEKQLSLLKCLEASLALCGICNDAPDDAVVSVCGHVFCNQCISEHLTGEDNQCPATNCKTRLSTSSVFSKATLNSSPSHQACDHLPGYSGSEVVEAEPCSRAQPCDSSKIKAALEVLLSLSKPQCHISQKSSVQSTSRESTDCSSTSADNGQSFNDVCEKKSVFMEKSSNSSVGSVGEKAIVFSQWTGMLDLLEACLKNSSIQYRRLDGTMSVIARDKAVKDFNTLPEVSVMIMSLKAASLGLNMVAACHVLMLDLWWNPTTEDQAIDRAHRIGQTRPVTVLRLTVKDTVEDRILALQQKKRKMVSSAFGEDGTGGRESRLTVDDLKYLFMM
ncbi:helicase-like transcription factor CHR28 isoform X2 [Cicer arietinum]|uniref:Helicase-like transcription factor CHR28 isoform X1 n=1 Tax=Cicer arietinum TaxID=3827 RepID=A0A1S2X9P4_CICAR|nr:helicase-like transcription factor CHR28 isoform X1 [Cicer arietinum]